MRVSYQKFPKEQSWWELGTDFYIYNQGEARRMNFNIHLGWWEVCFSCGK